ncbi:hypothetical protein [Luteibacter sp. UNCMF366Tsu5.1]|uniref:hypothetical protein n=1 Tax=Luteibacter sp. UNCMF366Tsu5.1 TaxID=1502758 RepID=UPI000930A732|nr:hypothetical protein [Luteibacter sp. UNCMF366Tsu5.1]
MAALTEDGILMTLVAAWTSRLSGGKFWDYGPKIFSIGRSDAVIAFAGDTSWTYPLIAQVSSYVESFVNLRDRTIDLAEAYELILRMLNDSLDFVSEPAHPSLTVPDCSFIFAGYSVRRKGFFVRRIVFHPGRGRFESRRAREIGDESFSVIGDKGPIAALARLVADRLKLGKGTRATLDMAPAEAFFEIMSSKRFTEIGGAPQVAKVYQHLNQNTSASTGLPTSRQTSNTSISAAAALANSMY